MNATSPNIWRVTQELNTVLRKLSAAEGVEVAMLIEQVLTPEAMQDFKLAVEAMRQLLWLYILAASRATHGDLNHSVQGLRLRRATDLLRVLREDKMPGSDQTAKRNSFLKQVDALVSYYLQNDDSTSSYANLQVHVDRAEAGY